MVDVVDKVTRSRMMSGIRTKDTKPEVIVRKKLHSYGYRYRKNLKNLPGTPDIVLKKYGAVIQIYGCFWHGHNCHLFKWPKSNEEFWHTKINTNRKNDLKNQKKLLDDGWKILVIWECALKGKRKRDFDSIIDLISSWLLTEETFYQIAGNMTINKKH